MLFKDVPLRTRRVLTLYKVYGIVPFWFSMEQCRRALMPFQLSANDMLIEERNLFLSFFLFFLGGGDQQPFEIPRLKKLLFSVLPQIYINVFIIRL